MEFAPGRLSTMTCWPSDPDNFCASCLARKSRFALAGAGAINRIGRAGYGCAAQQTPTDVARKIRIDMDLIHLVVMHVPLVSSGGRARSRQCFLPHTQWLPVPVDFHTATPASTRPHVSVYARARPPSSRTGWRPAVSRRRLPCRDHRAGGELPVVPASD